jgi:hypothetical protein
MSCSQGAVGSVDGEPGEGRVLPAARGKLWFVGGLVLALYAWPLLFAGLLHQEGPLIRTLTGDSYHYLAIARKALLAGFYTYDGLTVTNGFHPLWQYTLRGLYQVLGLASHQQQALAATIAALAFSGLGFALTAAAIARATGRPALGLLAIPGIYYLVAGVHVRNLSAWAMLDGMESALSALCAATLLFALSARLQRSGPCAFDLVRASIVAGAVAPLIVLARLDDIFLVVALTGAFLLAPDTRARRLAAVAWLTAPTAVVVLAYLAYNRLTAGAAMPLSGGTKAGLVLPLNAYLSAAIHFPPLMDLKAAATGRPSDGAEIFANSFRFVEMLYPALLAVLAGFWFWSRRHREGPATVVYLGFCGYIVLKVFYNFAFVHPWHQSAWYYAVEALLITFLGARVAAHAWNALEDRLTRGALACGYLLLVLLCSSQYYASIVYAGQPEVAHIWQRKDEIRAGLVRAGVHGIVNVDDGISAFLLDLPNVHGFAFATDVAAQRAHRAGKLLSLAESRNIDAIAGFRYLVSDDPPTTDAEIRKFLLAGVASDGIRSEVDLYSFSLAYFARGARMPFFRFERRRP